MKYDSVIILGYKRSGTSLLRVLLNSHPEIAIGPEMKFMQEVVNHYPKTFSEFIKIADREIKDFEFSQESLHKIYDASTSADELMRNWCMEYKEKTGKKIWGDKTPQNFKYLKLLSTKFPGSLFVHIVRNPFDVMISSKKRKQYHGIHTIIAWLVSNIKVKFVKKENYIFFKYEDFVKKPESYLSDILTALGVQDVDLLSAYRQVNHGRIADGDSWDQPIFESKERDDTILSAKDKMLIKLICSGYLSKYGYPKA